MAYWLLKTEPHAFSYADLARLKGDHWDGVKSPFAQANMKRMAVGDTCVIYHTGDEKRTVGLAKVVTGPYADPTDESGKRVWVDVEAARELEPTTLAEIKANKLFADSPLVRMGRLSVVPLTDAQFAALDKRA